MKRHALACIRSFKCRRLLFGLISMTKPALHVARPSYGTLEEKRGANRKMRGDLPSTNPLRIIPP